MSSLRRHISLGIFTAAAAGLTWAVATGTVENYPATLRYNIGLPGEALTTATVYAYPQGGNPAARTVNGPLTGPVDLLVNGGDPNSADPGLYYQPWIYAYFDNPSSTTSLLRVIKGGYTLVDNTAPNDPSTTVPVSFSYADVRRANVSVNLVGPGTLGAYYFYAYGHIPSPYEDYYAETRGTASSPTNISTWVPMAPSDDVPVYAEVEVLNPDGSATVHKLTAATLDVSNNDDSASWTIDLSNLGHIEGDLNLVTLPAGAVATAYTVHYAGTSSATTGLYGSRSVPVASPHYSFDLPAGDYNFSVVASFDNPSSASQTPYQGVSIVAGANPDHDFNLEYGKARVDVNIGGFFTNADLLQLETYLSPGASYSTESQSRVPSGNGTDQVTPFGTWQSRVTWLRLYDVTNPQLPLNSQLYRYHYPDADPSAPSTLINSAATTTVATENYTLVRSNVYLDVIEPSGAVTVHDPVLYLWKNLYNSDGSNRRADTIFAYGSPTPQLVSGLVVVGEPGVYNLAATGVVGNQQTNFGGPGAKITFGNPVNTPPTNGGPPVGVVLADDTDGDHLNVGVTFDDVTGGGLTTVVENPLGPEPPEGFKLSCTQPVFDANGDAICEPIYYDITSTATWAGTATVCIRRRSELSYGEAEDLLKLFHYNTSLAVPAWEQLPPSTTPPAFTDCSVDPITCGCPNNDPEACGVEYTPDFINVYMICGETSSFSPFALFEGRYTFTNKVNGVEYTGPNGPPSGLQHFVAPRSGQYRITASGARGTKATSAAASISGGCGAELAGDFTLQAGDILDILVGQMGTAATNSGGGGGGTFVAKNGVPLLVAGGGGGVRNGTTVGGRNALLTTGGGAGSTSTNYSTGFVAGGTSGSGGARQNGYGAGGGGWSGSGASDGAYGDGGSSFTGTGQGKGGVAKTCSGGLAHGGYGGGGAGNGCYGGGGGGGYSGGGGGRIGGGGGSLNTGANPHNEEGANACTATGQGLVTIERLTN